MLRTQTRLECLQVEHVGHVIEMESCKMRLTKYYLMIFSTTIVYNVASQVSII